LWFFIKQLEQEIAPEEKYCVPTIVRLSF